MDVESLTPALGSVVRGVNAATLDDPAFAKLAELLYDRGVLVLPDQDLDEAAQIAFASRFGEPEEHPIVEGDKAFPTLLRVHKPAGAAASFGTDWHTDNTFFEEPTSVTVLYALVVPPVGGDTLYASMTAAYDALSEPVARLCDGLRAVHTAADAYDPRVTGTEKYEGKAPIKYRYSDVLKAEVVHPVVLVHPESKRRALNVNPMFTHRIVGLSGGESRGLLRMLYDHAVLPDFTCRVRWQPRQLTIWDNRLVQHYAMNDYQGHERLMHRVTVKGPRPVGPAASP